MNQPPLEEHIRGLAAPSLSSTPYPFHSALKAIVKR